jgi:hypothetical protein
MPGNHPRRIFLSRILIGMGVLAALAVVLLGLVFWVIYRDTRPITIAVVNSPDGKIQGILQVSDGGAMSNMAFFVRLGSPDAGMVEVAKFTDAVRSKDGAGVDLVWLGNNTLEIRYFNARYSVLEQPSITMAGRPLTIHLAKSPAANGAMPGLITAACSKLSILCR